MQKTLRKSPVPKKKQVLTDRPRGTKTLEAVLPPQAARKRHRRKDGKSLRFTEKPLKVNLPTSTEKCILNSFISFFNKQILCVPFSGTLFFCRKKFVSQCLSLVRRFSDSPTVREVLAASNGASASTPLGECFRFGRWFWSPAVFDFSAA